MNKITLQGIIKNIEYSHTVQGIDYHKAQLITKRENGKEDIINLKFKRFSNTYRDNDLISIEGNIRTYSYKLNDTKNKVEVYVFTYMDEPSELLNNFVDIDGKICKIGELHKTKSGKDVIDFILANNISNNDKSLNCYVPVVAWGKFAKYISKLNIGDYLHINGSLQSREYKKMLNDSDFMIGIAHEINVINIIEDTNEI